MDMQGRNKVCSVTEDRLKKKKKKIGELSAAKSFCQNEQFRNRMKEGIKRTLPALSSSQLDQRMQGDLLKEKTGNLSDTKPSGKLIHEQGQNCREGLQI